MPNNSETNDTSAALSQVPVIHSFEFDKSAIGNIKSSVNKFRGSVSLPMDFLTVPGREGLDIKLSALYSSSIRNTMNNWNLDAPTGILGLGWQMPIEMIAIDKAGSRSATSDTYYLVSGGSANPMVKTGEESDGKWIFQLRNFEFWSVQYDPGKKIWTIVKENGFVSTYGAGSDPDSNATQWGVSWGNWMGSSSQRAAQEKYPLAWNLASIVTPLGHKVQYRYRNVDQKVMSNGLEYTQASYLKQVIDSYGRKITFNYDNKYGALNPDNTPDRQPVVEYQARHTQQAAPNAYQDRYETYFLDSVDVADADGEALYGIKFTYTFINHAPTSDSNYSLMYKRCLQSVFQYSPDGETLPAIAFEYVDGTNRINPGALNAVVYPGGGRASFSYKSNYLKSPKKSTVKNPLPGSTPRVWFGSNYVVFTYCNARSMKVTVQSWNGEWVTQDVTGVMGNKTADSSSLMVLAGENYFAVSFRNRSTGDDELYVFRNDDRGTELRFGTWAMYNNEPFILKLESRTAGASTFVAGDSFVMAYNNEYADGPVQGFSYTWQDGRWNANCAPPVPRSSDARYAAITAFQNYYAVSCYLPNPGQLKNYIFYRDLDGTWKSSTSNPWTINDIKVVMDKDRPYLAITPMPSGLVLTFVRGASDTTLKYSLTFFDWDDCFHVLNAGSPVSVELSSPIIGGKPQYQIFRTVFADSLVNNNLALMRNGGGEQSLSSCWIQKRFAEPAADATVALASGEDAAIFCSTTASKQSNQLFTFNPNNNLWSTPGVTQTGKNPSISGNYMTMGRNIYYRKTDGTWSQLTTQLSDFNYPESLQNRGPQYMAYQDVGDGSASTIVVALKNGGAMLLPKLSAQKMYVPSDLPAPGTMLAGDRFLVTYPSSAASFDASPTMDLYALDEVNLDQYVVDYPVASVEIEDPYDATQSYCLSFFYANSPESQIVYNAATGVAQYPMVTVVPGVKKDSELPPARQPQGRSLFYYSNGLAQQTTLYPSGGIQNYQNILNGIQLGQQDYDADNNLVSSQLNYWTVYSRNSSGKNLYGGYARCERVVSMKDGVQQQSTAGYDRTTGVMLWQEKTYHDAQGAAKKIRAESLYAWQVPEYASTFRRLHMYSSVAMTTKSVSKADGSSKTYIQSQATTYRNWANAAAETVGCAGSGPCRLAAYQTFDWTTPGSAAPQFPSAVPAPAAWQLKTKIVSRSDPQGMIVEQVDGAGLVSSFIYDKDQAHLVAKFPNGSISGNEVSYYGFESYERDSGWAMGAGASIIPNPRSPVVDAHTGTKSLSIAAATTGSNGIVRRFDPARQDQQYVFSAWVKKPFGFNNAAGNASWKIAVAGGTPSTLIFPDTVDRWVYVCQIITLPDPSGLSQIEIRCENANTACNVLVDNLRFTPLACLMEAYGYDPKSWQPNAVLGSNGETNRTVYDNFQQPILATNSADKTSKISKSYFSRSGNQGAFALDDPNHMLTIGSALGGTLTAYTRGSEWESVWQPQADVWKADRTVLTQKAGVFAGRLACINTALVSNYALAVEFNVLETLTSPVGIQLGAGLRIQWNPGLTSWQLLNSGGGAEMSPVEARALTLPSDPYATQLDRGTVSSGLCSAFGNAGYLLPDKSTVSAGAAGGKSWTLTSPDSSFRYALRLDGSQIAVYAMNRHWTLLVGESTVVFWADGKLIFSYVAHGMLSALPTLFFGNRVAISQIATAGNPQAAITFDDARGVVIQSQQCAGAQMIVSQAITDAMGRVAVRTKPAYVTAGQNPMFGYCAGFAAMNWAEGTMTGSLNAAYPADQGYPFSRQTFEASPLARVTQESVPGAPFIVGGGHSTRYSYGAVAGTNGALSYYKKTTINPNGDEFYEVSTLLDQVICHVSDKSGAVIKNETIYNDAGNAVEIHSPNYFSPPPGSAQSDWKTVQTFDYANRLLTSQSGAPSPLRLIYDAAGNIRFTQDAQGAKAGTYTYTKYDVLSRQTEAGIMAGTWNQAQLQQYASSDPSWPPTPPTWRKKYSYDGGDGVPDAIGRNTLILANNGSANTADVSEDFVYDIFGNTIADTLIVNAYDGGRENRVNYEYDNVGNITRTVYPLAVDGTRLNVYYRINSLNQITAISQTPDFTQPLGIFGYDAAGNPLENHLTLANGATIKQKYAFNSPYWLTDIRSQNPGETELFQETLTYTERGYEGAGYYDGTIASSSVQVGGSGGGQDRFHFSYDSIGQVVNAQNPRQPARNLGVTQPVSHDANGNFLDLAAGGIRYRFNYRPGSQEVSSVIDTAASATIANFEYDGNGNALRATTAASGITAAHDLAITYDPATILPVSVVDAGSGDSTVSLTYGCRNDRVMKQVSGGTHPDSKKLYIRGTSAMPLMERSTDGSTQAEVCYIFGPGGLIAMRKGSDLYLILKDHLGSVRGVLDRQGNVVASYQYLTYGALAQAQEPTPGFMTYLFAGQEYDAEIGLYNYRARFYCAGLGRFIAIDPGRQYFSPYLYASNNPVLFIDPTGMFSLKSFFGAMAGILIGAVEILIGVVIDVIAGVAEVFTGGLSTPASVAIAAFSGMFYGAGFSAETYSVFNFNDFSWKDYGIQMGIGAAAGLFSGGAGPLINAGAKSAQVGLTEFAQEARTTAAFLEVFGTEGIGTTVKTGALKGVAWAAEKSAAVAGLAAPGPVTAGWQGVVKGIGTGILKSEAIGISWTTGKNLASGNDWDKNLSQTIFNSALSGSISGLQIKSRIIYGTT
jgi:RHS repeat-associated protein